ncbi:Ankyrin repeat domain protein [Histomonas meleagridis]|uniref:Ankyrin repeat domain protein n=1 Tax=Histomonas meleagridis TaxID=135588 RepID=UPI0035595388|nr:Ankyrin repeat domain protein [Histomonas meleagridis]KAH0804704.1 Ankyrin repeat domain protein [Histomonas meleagridis]
MFEEPSANITQFLRDTLINDKVKFIKEFAVSDEEYNFKFEPTTTDLPEEIQYQCPILNVAIFYNAMNSFKHLVQGGSKLTGTDSWLCGPAHMAARCGRIKMLSHELLETINFQAMDWRGRTPAHYAAEFDHLDCLRFLIETKGCNPNARDKFGMTPLHLACANGHIDIIEYLIQNNAEWTTDALNRSPLEVAVEKGQIEALRFFASRNQSAIINSETVFF